MSLITESVKRELLRYQKGSKCRKLLSALRRGNVEEEPYGTATQTSEEMALPDGCWWCWVWNGEPCGPGIQILKKEVASWFWCLQGDRSLQVWENCIWLLLWERTAAVRVKSTAGLTHGNCKQTGSPQETDRKEHVPSSFSSLSDTLSCPCWHTLT